MASGAIEYLVLFILIFSVCFSIASDHIRLRTRTIDTDSSNQFVFKNDAIGKREEKILRSFIAQFRDKVSDSNRLKLQTLIEPDGGKIISYVPPKSFVFLATARSARNFQELPEVFYYYFHSF